MNRLKRWSSLLLLVLVVTFTTVVPVSAASSSGNPPVTIKTIEEVMQILKNLHISGPTEQELLQAAIDGMVRSLEDPYTNYMDAERTEWFTTKVSGQSVDPGFLFTVEDGGIYISRIYKDSPAAQAELLQGDRLVSVDNKKLTTSNVYDVLNEVMSSKKEGSTIKFQVDRQGAAVSKTLTLTVYDVPLVEKVQFGDIGYIRYGMFTPESTASFIQAVEELKKAGAQKLIVDIQGNPGGDVNAMLTMAGVFIGDEVALYAKDSDGYEVSLRTNQKRVWERGKPVYLLINEYSASSSDLLAAVLKDKRAAKLVGQTTFGKGVSQNLLPVPSTNGTVRVTNLEFVSPNRNKVHQVGVAPDVETTGPLSALLEALRLAGTAGSLELSYMNYGWSLNGLVLEEEVPYERVNGEVYLPARTLAAFAGQTLRWNDKTKSIEIGSGSEWKAFGKEKGYLNKNGTGYINVRIFTKDFPSVSFQAEGNSFVLKLKK